MEQNKTKNASSQGKIGDFLKEYGSIIGILALLLIFHAFDHRFLRPANIWGVLKSSAFLIMMSLSMTLVMSVRGIDFSIAQVADAAAVISAYLILHDTDPMLALVIAIGFGLLVGIVNAFLMAYLGVPALIGTLGMMFIIRSFELLITNGAQPQVLFTLSRKVTGKFLDIGQGSVGVVPNVMVISICVVIIIYLIKERSVIGRHMDAINGNVQTSFLAGINIRRTFASVFVISSVLAAIAGVLICARAGSATPRATESYLNDCFVSVYIGTLLSKRRKFNVIGTVIGCLFVGFISNFFTLMNLGNGIKQLCNGAFIILAVVLGAVSARKKD
ncbi:MAG: ABC transporter permease [Blautia sp.]|nr:ABC transporter permease [Blautia sp.]